MVPLYCFLVRCVRMGATCYRLEIMGDGNNGGSRQALRQFYLWLSCVIMTCVVIQWNCVIKMWRK